MQPVSSTGVGSRGAADSIGEDRLLELSSRDVQWPQSWVSISSWGISAFKGPGHRLTSRRASFLKSVFAGGQVLWGLHYSCLPMAFMPSCPALSLVDPRCTNSTIAGCSVERMQVQ